ncbi:MAG: aldose 1-epimerase [Bryobacteraceae bacterium]
MRVLTAALLFVPIMTEAANYSAARAQREGVEIVVLTDGARDTRVSIAASVGNIAYEMSVNGKNVFWTPFDSPAELKAKPALSGNPFLAPWANRLDQDAFFANGKRFALNPALGNVRRDGNKNPIHGLLAFSPYWKVVDLKSDEKAASVTSRLEFFRYPELMAQFPFAHTLEMTYRLTGGVLEVETLIRNHATEAMPVGVGYHPYFQVHDAPRDEWKVQLAAREHLTLSKLLIPTGERKAMPFSSPVSLNGTQLDDVFSGLVRNRDGKAEFSVTGKNQKVSVIYGPKYTVAVVYAPRGRNFICFEPMSAITNAFNLAHAGVYRDLQSIAPGEEWRESFWIEPSGF